MSTPKNRFTPLRVFLAIAGCVLANPFAIAATYTETPEAFRNPMKGFRPSRYITQGSFPAQEYATIYKDYIPYSALEASASDGVQKIKDYCNSRWVGIEGQNIKVIPRVLIVYPGTGEYWPSDIPHDGTAAQWNTDTLKNRLAAFIGKLAQAWDNDPRVAAVELGLWGKWGEHNIYPDQINGSDRIPLAFQQAMGDAATAAFHNKIVMVRYPETFTGYNFGMLWDSFALPDDVAWANAMSTRTTWQTRMISGEVAYDWGNQSQLGGSPDGTLGNASNTDYVIGYIQQLHASSLGWIAEYTASNPTIAANAARMQKAFGYRFVVTSATVPTTMTTGANLSFSFTVENRGSAPFYYQWPIEVSLLNPTTHAVVWSTTLSTDIRAWMPGNSYTVSPLVTVPVSVPNGTYTVALAVLDPAGYKPSLRFANTNYYTGGRTPLSKIGVGQAASDQNLGSFNSLKADTTLSYSLTGGDGSNPTYEAEGSSNTLSGGALRVSSANGSGGMKVGYLGNGGALVVNGVNASSAASYTMTVYYMSGETRSLRIKANNGTSVTSSLPSTGGWDTVGSFTMSVTLNSGNNTITFDNPGGWAPDIDKIVIGGAGTIAPVGVEAEASANTIAGGALVSTSVNSSGGMKVGYLGNGGTLVINGLTMGSTRSYTLTVYYLSGEARGLRVKANNGTAAISTLPSSGGWDTVGSFTTSVALNSGSNTITFDNPSGWAPDIDKIVISGDSF